jgi:hypothetical protein
LSGQKQKTPYETLDNSSKIPHARGLVALWREALLAQADLAGQTRGYTNHPQMVRFRAAQNPRHAISHYLIAIYQEAVHRDYSFDGAKIKPAPKHEKMPVTEGQVLYEFSLLLSKLENRNRSLIDKLRTIKKPVIHPLFKRVPGNVEQWEKTISAV